MKTGHVPHSNVLLSAGWRLPTREELEILNDNMDKIGGFNSSAWYWSSTEHSDDYAWDRRFSDCFVGGHVKNDNVTTHRARCVRSIALDELSGKGISQDAPIGERLDLNGEEVVFAGIDENGVALIVAAEDEPGPHGHYKMNWHEAMKFAEMNNQQEYDLHFELIEDLISACDMLEMDSRTVADIMHAKGDQGDPILSERLSGLWQSCNKARSVIDVVRDAIQEHRPEQKAKPKLPRM